MKLYFLLCLLPFLGYAQSETPKELVENFFIAFHQKDTLQLKKYFHANARLETISKKQNDSKVTSETVEQFLQSIAKIPKEILYEEKLLGFEVAQDSLMAKVWAPYVFNLNGVKNHEGSNLFVLIRVGEVWKILYLVDSRIK